MFTRKEYMNAPRELQREAFHRFYGEVVEAARLRVPHIIVRRCQRALMNGDENFSTIPLAEWDRLAEPWRPYIDRALRDRGDFWSLAGGVCAMKEAARRQIEQENLHRALSRHGLDSVPCSCPGKREVYDTATGFSYGPMDSEEGWRAVRLLDAAG